MHIHIYFRGGCFEKTDYLSLGTEFGVIASSLIKKDVSQLIGARSTLLNDFGALFRALNTEIIRVSILDELRAAGMNLSFTGS